VGLVGFEPTTPALSRRCSNRLSYRPAVLKLSCSPSHNPHASLQATPHPSNTLDVPCCCYSTADKCGYQDICLLVDGFVCLCSAATSSDKSDHVRFAVSRKEVIQPHLPIRLPCYDFTPVTNPAVVIALLAVRLTTSGGTRSHGVTGGVYKTRERIHRGKLIRDY